MNVLDENLLWLIPESGEDDLSNHLHRQLIGYVGLLLPVALWLMAGLRPAAAFQEHPWKPLNSISAYYHTSAVPVLSGGLVALALFLFAYRGYKNEYRRRDRAAAIAAGIGALLAALFPGKAPGAVPRPLWWSDLVGQIHFVGAILLFGSFVFFSFFQFPRSSAGKLNLFKCPRTGTQELDVGKWVRNWLYIACGVAISACLVWSLSAVIAHTSLFWAEALALEFFAASWLVKGRADKTVGRAWRVIRGKM